MKPNKHLVAAACVVMAAVFLIALTWIGTMREIRVEQQDNTARVVATLSNQALSFTEQINRQMLALDQTLRILVAAWEADPGHFSLEAWRNQTVALQGISLDIVLTDENGTIRQSTVNEAINQNASGLDYFRVLADPADTGDTLYIGPATIDGIMRQWHMNVARSLHHSDGSFAGVIDADYRIAAITDVFSQTDLGAGAFMTLASLDDGKLRGAVGPATIDPDASIDNTPMFAAVRDAASGIWIGPSANDAVQRIHAFRHLPGRNFTVIVAMNEEVAMRPATAWRERAEAFANCIAALLAVLALVLLRGIWLARRRKVEIAEARATLAASNAQVEVARALAAAKAEQLEATLAGMTDGVSVIDAHMCLVEWNARFPTIAGVPAEILRFGMPLEEIIRAQIKTGQFGAVTDPEAEVERQVARLRVARFGVTQRRRSDGHTVELRRNRLPDGGFVTLLADITERKLAEDALRQARAEAGAANTAKSRFMAIVIQEIRAPLGTLLDTLKLFSSAAPAPVRPALLATAHQTGDRLLGLVDDILDLSRIEAGQLAIQPSVFELAPLLENVAEAVAARAMERGVTIGVTIAEGAPATLLTDPGRLRQMLLALLSTVAGHAHPGTLWLIAEPAQGPQEAVQLVVRDAGPVMAPDVRAGLFHPLSRRDQPQDDDLASAGLRLSLCHQLTTLMGGTIGCDVWQAADRAGGNTFRIILPASVLPFRPAPVWVDTVGTTAQPERLSTDPVAEQAVVADGVPRRPSPRTRVLLADDVVANQRVTATLLRREGHHVDIAADGPAAIKAVRSTPYDLVFMDIFMPGMTGQEATRIVRTLPEPARSIPIIALTAGATAEDEARFRAAGMNGVLSKPVSLVELLDAVDKHVWSVDPSEASMPEEDDGGLEWAATERSYPVRPNPVPVV
ncbi:MAG: hypothetical protein QOH05_2619, partial [Acetobacteraceae bacterium]|nr:hypothetical protein [Acetobacteraceae bacterium]